MMIERTKLSIIYGDCLEQTDSIKDHSIDMVLCDLPYGVTRNKWDAQIDLERLWGLYRRVVKEDGAIALFASGMFTSKLMESNPKDWRYNLIWHKTNPTGFLNANRMPLRSHEDICIFYRKLPVYNPQKIVGPRKVASACHKRNSKKGSSYGDYEFLSYDSTERYPTSVLTFPRDTQKVALHPAQKPVALCEWLIRTYTNEGMTVMDNCMGSGTTGVAAMNTGRHFIGIEKDADYYQIARKRLAERRKINDKHCD